MTKRQSQPVVVHGRHAKKSGKTKCGMSTFKLPDGNHRIVGTNAIGQVTCAKCRKNNKPGIC